MISLESDFEYMHVSPVLHLLLFCTEQIKEIFWFIELNQERNLGPDLEEK